MKNYLLSMMALCGAAVCLTGCLGDVTTTATYEGVGNAYVVNSGNMYSQIAGSITAFNYDLANSSSVTIQDEAFQAANGRSLGMVPNDLIIYGEKMYIAVDKENTIEVVDRNTLKSLNQIKTTELLGASEGSEPRHLAADYGKLYVTTYGGYVAVIDTATFALKTKYKVGSYPEEIVLTKSYAYVANSDYARGKEPSVSRVDLNTGTETKITEGVVNPTEIALCNNCIFVLEGSTYNDDYSVKTKCDSIGVVVGNRVVHLENAIDMDYIDGSTSYGSHLYYIAQDDDSIRYYRYTPYGSTNPTGGYVDTLFDGGPQHPASITADPNTGNIYVAYYQENASGNADYTSPAYVNIYQNDGTIIYEKLQVGICPRRFEFNKKKFTY